MGGFIGDRGEAEAQFRRAGLVAQIFDDQAS
jgi:hypothetical protein